MFNEDMTIQSFDPELSKAIEDEIKRQEEHIELIASENYASPRVIEAQGSVLTNKYAEGYPGKRYYGGCEYVDVAEQLAIDRLKELYGADYANVQPHSGSQANAAVFMALLQPHDTILGMSLAHGGHLTHGSKVNFSGKIYNGVQYGLNPETGEIDYDQVEALAKEHKPKMIIAGFSAYSRVLDWKRFRDIADSIGAYFFVDMAHVSGLVAGGVYPSPVPYADIVTSTTHKSLRGPRSGMIFSKKHLSDKIDFAVFPSLQGGPHNNVISAVAVALKEASTPEFHEYILNVKNNAKLLGKELQNLGYQLCTNGTDNHLLLLNLRNQGITGSKVEYMLEKVNISVNKNTIIGDKSALSPSGIRIGLCAMTTRGLQEKDCQGLANLIHKAITLAKGVQCKKLIDFKKYVDEGNIDFKQLKEDVFEFSSQFSFPNKL